jgi:NAD(P)H nitroreductase ydgI
MMNMDDLLKCRHSVRHFDPSAKIGKSELFHLIDTANRSPSSNNAQPWRIMVITEQTLREKLLPVAFGQQQVLTASAILVLLADRQAYQAENLTRIHQEEFKDGCFNKETRDFLIQAAIGFYQPFDENDTQKSLALDCGLWAMSFMLTAEEAGWNTVPMTGYEPDRMREVLNIPPQYLDIMLIAIGKGLQEGHRTLRQTAEQTITWNTLPQG